MRSYIGLIVGTKTEAGAICFADVENRLAADSSADRPLAKGEAHYLIRVAELIPPGESLDTIFQRILAIMRLSSSKNDKRPSKVYLDITHRGRQLFGHFERRFPYTEFGLVKLNAGVERLVGDREIELGKAWLAFRLENLLSTFRLHLPRRADLEIMAEEILDFEAPPDFGDRGQLFKIGNHDPLASAIGLAVQSKPRSEPARSADPSVDDLHPALRWSSPWLQPQRVTVQRTIVQQPVKTPPLSTVPPLPQARSTIKPPAMPKPLSLPKLQPIATFKIEGAAPADGSTAGKGDTVTEGKAGADGNPPADKSTADEKQ